MAFFCEAGLEATGYREKMRLCEKCGRSLVFTPGEGFCCPAGHGCEWPKKEWELPTRHGACSGNTIKKGSSKGRKRKKPRKQERFSGLYAE